MISRQCNLFTDYNSSLAVPCPSSELVEFSSTPGYESGQLILKNCNSNSRDAVVHARTVVYFVSCPVLCL